MYVGEVNAAYEAFLDKYLILYERHCPYVQCRYKDSYSKNPWITRGLQNACKKKNKLYRDFIKFRSKEAEMKYKLYKNKLTTIMRQAKKDYFGSLLEKNKTDIKGTWNILNKLIGKSTSGQDSTPHHFVNEDNKKIENLNEVVNEFNSFFVNVGPKLAENIEKHNLGPQNGGTRGSRVLQSMFIGDVSENKILSIVNALKNKTSTDTDGLDMIIVKKTIDCIVKPLSYIFNLSFQTGIFPNRMKVAKVVPLYKDGDKHMFTNYRPISLLSQFSKVLEKIFVQKLDEFVEKKKNSC